MKRKFTFSSMFALIGAFLLLVSACGKDYSKELDQVKSDIAVMQKAIDELKAGIGKTIKDATVSNGELTLTWSDNTTTKFTPSQKYPTVVEKAEGWVNIKFWDGTQDQTFKFQLAGAGGITDLELMGYVKDYDPTASISMFSGSGDNYLVGIDNNLDAATVNFNYAHIVYLQNKTWPSTTSNRASWTAGETGGKYTIEKNQVLTDIEGTVVLVRVSPADVEASEIEFALQNSALNGTSFNMKAAQKVTLPMTRAAGGSAVWAIPLVDNGATFANLNQHFFPLYHNSAPSNYVFAVAAGENVSNYGLDFAGTAAGSPLQTYVVEVGGNGPVMGITNPYPSEAAGASNSPIFDVIVDTDYSLTFESTLPEFDYYVQAIDQVSGTLAGLQVNKTAGTFKVTTNPDLLTSAFLPLNVYAVQLDGTNNAAYVGTTEIILRILPKPLAVTTYNLGNITIEDGMTPTTQNSTALTDVTGYLPVIKVDLAQMFTDLGTDNAAKWKSSALGAANLGTIATSTTIKHGATTVTTDFLAAATPATMTFTRSNGTTATTSPTDAANMMLTLNYADDASKIDGSGTAVPTFVPGEQYTVTTVFKNSEGAQLNTVVVNFTPVLPALSDFLEKDKPFWNDDQTVLHGYFKESTPVLATQPAKVPQYNIATDGGVLSAGSYYTKRHLPLTLATSATQRFNGTLANSLIISQGTALNNNNFNVSSTVVWANGTGGTAYAAGGGLITNPAYNQPTDIVVTAGRYLDTYTYDPDAVAAALNFKLQLASAVERGTITPANDQPAIIAPFTTPDTYFLRESAFKAVNYNNVAYHVFKEWTALSPTGSGAAYKYTYIQNVAVSVPTQYQVYYSIVDAAGTAITTPVPPVDPTVTPVRPEGSESYIGLKLGNLTQTTTVAIRFTITDVFGYVKTVDVPITLQKNY